MAVNPVGSSRNVLPSAGTAEAWRPNGVGCFGLCVRAGTLLSAQTVTTTTPNKNVPDGGRESAIADWARVRRCLTGCLITDNSPLLFLKMKGFFLESVHISSYCEC